MSGLAPGAFALRLKWRRRLELVRPRVICGELCRDELQRAAMEAPHDPWGGGTLVRLATMDLCDSEDDARAHFSSLVAEQRIPSMSEEKAFRRYTVHQCERFLAGEITEDACQAVIYRASFQTEIDSRLHNFHCDRNDFDYNLADFDALMKVEAERWTRCGPLGPTARADS